jgi:hypothetical protein
LSILQVPRAVVQFFSRFVDTSGVPQYIAAALPSLVAAIALGVKRSYQEQGQVVTERVRHRANISRLYRDRKFNSRDLHWATVAQIIRNVSPVKEGERATWLMVVDGFAVLRGAYTKIRGGICRGKGAAEEDADETTDVAAEPRKPAGGGRGRGRRGRQGRGGKKRTAQARRTERRKARAAEKSQKRRKGGRRATKYFTFLGGTLTTHEGLRLALPRSTCDPQDFHRTAGRPKKTRDTQIDLASKMIDRVMQLLPDGVELVVMADSYFDSDKLFRLTKTHHFVFICPADSARCFGQDAPPHRSTGRRLRDHGLDLPWNAFSRLDLCRGSEGTARLRRYSAREAGPRDRRTYWVKHETRTVAGLGPVGVAYSWKTPVYTHKANFRRRQFKVLLCSDPTWSGEKMAEFYEMRYAAIEHVIREWKSDLGLTRNLGQSLPAMERYIDMVLLTFLCLEMYRNELLDDPSTGANREVRTIALHARTRGMQHLLRREADLELLHAISRSYTSERVRRRVQRHLSRVIATADARACGPPS